MKDESIKSAVKELKQKVNRYFGVRRVKDGVAVYRMIDECFPDFKEG